MIKKIIAASAIGFFLLSGIAFAEKTVTPSTDTQTEQAPVDTPADDNPADETPEADK